MSASPKWCCSLVSSCSTPYIATVSSSDHRKPGIPDQKKKHAICHQEAQCHWPPDITCFHIMSCPAMLGGLMPVAPLAAAAAAPLAAAAAAPPAAPAAMFTSMQPIFWFLQPQLAAEISLVLQNVKQHPLQLFPWFATGWIRNEYDNDIHPKEKKNPMIQNTSNHYHRFFYSEGHPVLSSHTMISFLETNLLLCDGNQHCSHMEGWQFLPPLHHVRLAKPRSHSPSRK